MLTEMVIDADRVWKVENAMQKFAGATKDQASLLKGTSVIR